MASEAILPAACRRETRKGLGPRGTGFAGGAQRRSDISLRRVAQDMSNSTGVNGRPVEVTTACRNASRSPISSAIATTPSNVHQKTGRLTGASTLPPALILSMISEPESDEVTKKTITRMIPTSR